MDVDQKLGRDEVIMALHMKAPFPCVFCLKLHDFTQLKPKIFLGRTPDSPVQSLTHFTKLKQTPRNVVFAWRKHRGMSYL